jgi:hypothetical protein
MKKLLLLSVLCVVSFGIYSQTKSYKRGVSYGFHSVNDMENASQNISWWYNWAAQPDVSVRNTYQNYNVDFTPMAWNNVAISGVNSWAERDSLVKYILGFNEPNFKEQANMTPKQAAAAWPALQKIAQKHDLKIVSPAVNYCGNCVSEGGTTYTNPFTYLDDFFKACDTCQVDFIGLHWYGAGNSIMSYIKDARKYKKPIWVTEFASWDNNSRVPNVNEQKKYLAGTVNFLERDPDIYRYSWFIGRTQGGISAFPYIDLYAASGMLTELGQLYMDIPVYDPEMKFTIPGRIETEEYYLMSGLFSEPTSDIDGFLNIGWTDVNDWAEYKISVEKSGTYILHARVAGTGQGAINFLVNNQLKAQINSPNTGGWQNWRTVSKEIELEEGEHILKMLVKVSGFNINWIEISNSTSVKNEIEIMEAVVYPNPVKNGIINIVLNGKQSGGEFNCSLVDIHGKQVFSKNVNVNRALFQINMNEKGRLPAGVYYLNVSGEKSMTNKLIIVQ